MPSGAEARTSRGGDPIRLAGDLAALVLPRESDLEFALEMQRSRILERIAQGVDYEGKPFAPYSRRSPFYYYPSTQRGRTFRPGQRVLERIWAGETTFRAEYFRALRSSAQRMSRKLQLPKEEYGVTAGGGIKFRSYADFKQKLGRQTVDLTGPRAPHMLQAVVVRVHSAIEGAIGIYGAEAKRASGHHDGVPKRKLPRRRFLGASQEDQEIMLTDMAQRVRERAEERLGQ